jgi:hypothetical protein
MYQKKRLEEVVNQYLQVLITLDLDYIKIRIFYQTIFSPKIQYITQLSSLTHPNIKTMITKCNQITLQEMGYSSSTPKGAYIGHKNFAGLELIDPYILQGAQNSIQLAQSLHYNNPTLQIVKTFLLMVDLSRRKRILSTVKTRSSQFNHKLIMVHRIKIFFLCEYRLEIHLNIPIPSLLREHDNYIMHLVSTQGYTKKLSAT